MAASMAVKDKMGRFTSALKLSLFINVSVVTEGGAVNPFMHQPSRFST